MAFLKDVIAANKEIYGLINAGAVDVSEFLHKDETQLGCGGDRSLLIDKLSEDIFIKYLEKYGKILSEESGAIGSGDFEIVLDPIDGSSNLSANFPYYGTSVALKKDGKVIFSIVSNLCDGYYIYRDETGLYQSNFLHDVRASAVIPNKARCNLGLLEKTYGHLDLLEKIINLNVRVRTPGAAALSLAYAHRVGFVVFCGRQRPYDVTAGLDICKSLNTFVSDDIIIVSKDENMFNSLKGLLL